MVDGDRWDRVDPLSLLRCEHYEDVVVGRNGPEAKPADPAADRVLVEDQPVIDPDFVDAEAAGHKFNVDSKLLADLVRESLGVGTISTGSAVFDSALHWASPRVLNLGSRLIGAWLRERGSRFAWPPSG
jgi:hypothetical protein